MTNKKLFESVQEIADLHGVSVDDVLKALSDSLVACAKHTLPEGEQALISVDFNVNNAEFHIFKERKVVETLSETLEEDQMPEVTLEEAKKIKKNIKVGDTLIEEMNPKGEEFTRTVIRSVLSTLKSNLKNLGRQKAYDYFKEFENEMIEGEVVSKDDNKLVIRLQMGVTTIIPKSELLPNDHFDAGDKINVYVKEVEKTTKDPKIKVSRTNRNLITRLMEEYIPEVKDGIIEIKGIARDAGSRCKIAVYSNNPNVDPIGSCVGPEGSRIREIVKILNNEQIDLYKWSEDPEELVSASLQPSKVTKVVNIDPKTKTCRAIVPDDQLSLAIGKNGQNVRLAVQSCGWNIDIKPSSQSIEELGLM